MKTAKQAIADTMSTVAAVTASPSAIADRVAAALERAGFAIVNRDHWNMLRGDAAARLLETGSAGFGQDGPGEVLIAALKAIVDQTPDDPPNEAEWKGKEEVFACVMVGYRLGQIARKALKG